jgi:hypothetical protein
MGQPADHGADVERSGLTRRGDVERSGLTRRGDVEGAAAPVTPGLVINSPSTGDIAG